MAIKKGEFIKLNYTGKLADGTVFDTTIADVAKDAGIEGTKELHPVVICVGEQMLLKGLDQAVEGETEKSFSVTLKPEDAFGKKDPKLVQVIPTPQLLKQGIRPQVGLELNIDGRYCVVRRTGGGRTSVDFNHPLASQEVTYEIEVVETITKADEQIKALLDTAGIPYKGVSVKDKTSTITVENVLPKQYMDALNETITRLTKITTVNFDAGEKK